MNATAIRARGLTRRFGDLVAVDRLDLDIEQSRICGFLGPNGSGKSTTIRMLCGLLVPIAGEIDVLGHVLPAGSEALRRRIGYMTQSFSLYRDLSVRENLDFIGMVYGLRKAARDEAVRRALRGFDLEAQRRQRAGTLSGGQKQRLALAVATLHRPELLILDEPTSAVDPQSRRDFWDTLFELAAGGATILVSTHFMDEAERCHRLAILDRGRLVAEGRPADLKRDIPARVIEIETAEPERARQCLLGEPWIASVAQMGNRLHALVARHQEAPAVAIEAVLHAGRIAAAAHDAPANLEDVFVAATGFKKR